MAGTDLVVEPTTDSGIRPWTAFRARWLIVALVLLAMAWGVYHGVVICVRNHYEARCLAAWEKGDWPALEPLACRWARWETDRALPWLYAAQAASEQQRHAQAAVYLERLPDGDPQTPAARLKLAELYFGPLNQPLAGVATCERILRNDPACGEAHRQLMSFYAMTLQRAKMVQQAREAIERHCETPEAYVYVIGAEWLTFSGAYQWNSRWLTHDPDNELFLVARAVHYLGAKQADENAASGESAVAKTAKHERMMTDLLKRFPQNLELLCHFLQKAVASGDMEQIRELLPRAPAASAADNRFWRFKGWLHVAQQEYSRAEEAYRRALALNPYDWHSQHELAGVMRRLKKTDQVESLESRSTTGNEVRKAILTLPNMQSIPTPLLRRMAAYAEACGDYAVAENLSLRIETLREGKPAVSRIGADQQKRG